MCTVSWLHQTAGYLLLCNRDEKRTRKTAELPRIDEKDAVRFLTPRDGGQRGSWIAVNEFGLALTLLNGASPKSPPARSRGLLLLDWISARSAAELAQRVEQTDLTPYAPFTIAALQPGAKATVHRWNGVKKTAVENGEGCMPLTSSSADAPAAQFHRRMEFRRLLAQTGRLDAHLLRLFHESHRPHPSALTACMHRDDAQTVSFSRVSVDDKAVRLFYSPAPPCRHTAGVQLDLPRR
ncbi:MAG: NRDE family protein [Acidobacteria bacterium]|nr:NRDE family protein [Acidobacteriota bacterium]